MYSFKHTDQYITGANVEDRELLQRVKDRPVYFDDAKALKDHIVRTAGKEAAAGGFDDHMTFMIRVGLQYPRFRNDKDSRRLWTLRHTENLRVYQNLARRLEKDMAHTNRAKMVDLNAAPEEKPQREKLTAWATAHNLKPATGGWRAALRFVRKQIADDALRTEFDREFGLTSAEFCG